MRDPLLPKRSLPALLATLATAALLSACATPGGEQTTGPVEPIATPGEEGLEAMQMPDSAFAESFAAAESALLDFDWMSAEVQLADVDGPELLATDRMYRSYLEARIHYLRGDQPATDEALAAANRAGSHPALTSKLTNFQRHRAELSGNYLEGARLSDQLLRRSRSPEARAALERLTWRNLQRLEEHELEAARSTGVDPQWLAWLELASLSRSSNRAGLDGALRQWLARNPGHPAGDPLPGGLGYILGQPPAVDRVVLMLPLSGRLAPAGKAVRDGYLAAHFAAAGAGQPSPEVLVFDRLGYESTSAAYQAAVSAGADLVIGPLTKQAVAELGRPPQPDPASPPLAAPTAPGPGGTPVAAATGDGTTVQTASVSTASHRRSVPVLALNRSDRPVDQQGSALVQFSLAPEDEADQLAAVAFGRGDRRALIVRPAGVWGDKMEQALTERWQGLGGSVAATASYSSAEDYAKSLTGALGLTASEQRRRDLRTRLALENDIEFTPRRRQDLDAVFLLSRTPAEARALKPLLSYYYAGELPVYATSSVHRGMPDAGDKDLTGITLLETPWLLGSNPGLRLAIAAGDTGSDAYTRLNALGADAHRLQASFLQFRAGPDALVRGDTGLLTLDPQLRIHRETRQATFDGGVLKPM